MSERKPTRAEKRQAARAERDALKSKSERSARTRRRFLKGVAATIIVGSTGVATAECGPSILSGISQSLNRRRLAYIAPEVQSMNRFAYNNMQQLMNFTPRIEEFADDILQVALGSAYQSNTPARYVPSSDQFMNIVLSDTPCLEGSFHPRTGIHLSGPNSIILNSELHLKSGDGAPLSVPAEALLDTTIHEKLHKAPDQKPVEQSDLNWYLLAELAKEGIRPPAIFQQGVGIAFDIDLGVDKKNKPCILIARTYLEEAIVDEATRRFLGLTGLKRNYQHGYDQLVSVYKSRILRLTDAQEILKLQNQSKGRDVVEILGLGNKIHGRDAFAMSERLILETLAPYNN